MTIAEILKINPLTLEMGAGIHPRMDRSKGWLFNDLMALPGIDLVAPCDNLGLPPNSVSKLYCAHLIEHIPSDLIPKTLAYWYGLLRHEGSLEILCPSCDYAMRVFLKHSDEDKVPPAMIYRCIWGTRDAGTEALPPHNFHHVGFTKSLLKIYLSKMGFVNIVVKDFNRFGIPDRDIYAIAYKD
jgi:hypothetical protein